MTSLLKVAIFATSGMSSAILVSSNAVIKKKVLVMASDIS